jgi:hypothetical protein
MGLVSIQVISLQYYPASHPDLSQGKTLTRASTYNRTKKKDFLYRIAPAFCDVQQIFQIRPLWRRGAMGGGDINGLARRDCSRVRIYASVWGDADETNVEVGIVAKEDNLSG